MDTVSKPPSINATNCLTKQAFSDIKLYTEGGVDLKTLDEEAYHFQRGALDVAPLWANSLMGAFSSDDA